MAQEVIHVPTGPTSTRSPATPDRAREARGLGGNRRNGYGGGGGGGGGRVDVVITSPDHFGREALARSQLGRYCNPHNRLSVEEVDQGRAPTPHSVVDGAADIPGFGASTTALSSLANDGSQVLPMSLAAELQDIERASKLLLENMERMDASTARTARSMGARDVRHEDKAAAEKRARTTETGAFKGIGSRTAERALARKQWERQNAPRGEKDERADAKRPTRRRSEAQPKAVPARAVSKKAAQTKPAPSRSPRAKNLSQRVRLPPADHEPAPRGERSRPTSETSTDGWNRVENSGGLGLDAELARVKSELDALHSAASIRGGLQEAQSETLALLESFPQFTQAIKSMERDTTEATRTLHERIGTLVQSYRHMNELAARAPLGFLSAELAQDKERPKPEWMPRRDEFDHALLQAEAHDIAFRKRQIDAMLQDAHQPVFAPFGAQTDLGLVRKVRDRILQIDAEIVAFVEDAFAFRARQVKDEAREDARMRARRRHPMAKEDKENTVLSTFEPIAPWMGPEAWARARHPIDAKEPPKPPKILRSATSRPRKKFIFGGDSGQTAVAPPRRDSIGSAASDAPEQPSGVIEDPPRERPAAPENPSRGARQISSRERVRQREEESAARRKRAQAAARRRAREDAQNAARAAKLHDAAMSPVNQTNNSVNLQGDANDAIDDGALASRDRVAVEEVGSILDALEDRRHTQAAFEASERAAASRPPPTDKRTADSTSAEDAAARISVADLGPAAASAASETAAEERPGGRAAVVIDYAVRALGPRQEFAWFAALDAVCSVLMQSDQSAASGRELWSQCLATAIASYMQAGFAYRVCLQEAAVEALLDENLDADAASDMLTILERVFSARDAAWESVLSADTCATMLALAHQRVSASRLSLSSRAALTGLLGSLRMLDRSAGPAAFASAVRAAQGVQLAMLGQSAEARARAAVQAANAIFAQTKSFATAPAGVAAVLAAVQGAGLGFARGASPFGDLEISALAAAISAHCAQSASPLQEAGQAAVRAALACSLRVRQQLQQALDEAMRSTSARHETSALSEVSEEDRAAAAQHSALPANRVDALLSAGTSTSHVFTRLRAAFYGMDPLVQKQRLELGSTDAVAARVLVEVATESAALARNLDDQGAAARAMRSTIERMQDLLRIRAPPAPKVELAQVRESLAAGASGGLQEGEEGAADSPCVTMEGTHEVKAPRSQDSADLVSMHRQFEHDQDEERVAPLRPSIAQLESYLRSSVLAEVLTQEAKQGGAKHEQQAPEPEPGAYLSTLGGGGVVQWFMDRDEPVDRAAVENAAVEAISAALEEKNDAAPAFGSDDAAWDMANPPRAWSDTNILDLVTNLVLAELGESSKTNEEEEAEKERRAEGEQEDASVSEHAANAALASRLAAEAAERAILAREESVRAREKELLEQERAVALREAETRAAAARSELQIREEMLVRGAADAEARQDLLVQHERSRAADLAATLDKFGQLQLQTLGLALDQMQQTLLASSAQQQQQQQQLLQLQQQNLQAAPALEPLAKDAMEAPVATTLATQTDEQEMGLLLTAGDDLTSPSPERDSPLSRKSPEGKEDNLERKASEEDSTSLSRDSSVASSGEASEAQMDAPAGSHEIEHVPLDLADKEISLLDLSGVQSAISPRADSLNTSISLVLPAGPEPQPRESDHFDDAREDGAISARAVQDLLQRSAAQQAQEPAKRYPATLLEWSDSEDEDGDNEGDGASADTRSLSDGELEVNPGDFSDGEEVPLTLAYRSALQPAETGAPWPPGQMPDLDDLRHSKAIQSLPSPLADSGSDDGSDDALAA